MIKHVDRKSTTLTNQYTFVSLTGTHAGEVLAPKAKTTHQKEVYTISAFTMQLNKRYYGTEFHRQ
jgi:hypothetical protein